MSFDFNAIPGFEDLQEDYESHEYVYICNNDTKINSEHGTKLRNGDIYLSNSKTKIGSIDNPFNFSIVRAFDTYVVWDEVNRKPLKYTYDLREGGAWSDGTPIIADDLLWVPARDQKTGSLLGYNVPKYNKTLNLIICTEDQIKQDDPQFYILALGSKNKAIRELVPELKKHLKALAGQHKITRGAYELILKTVVTTESNDRGAWYEWGKFDFVKKMSENPALYAKMDKLLKDTEDLKPQVFTITKQVQSPPMEKPASQLTAPTDDFKASMKPAIEATNVPKVTEVTEEEGITELTIELTDASEF